MMGITNQPDELVGLLTSENAKAVLKNLQSRYGVEELAEPEVTTPVAGKPRCGQRR